MGSFDRVARILVAAIIVVLYFAGTITGIFGIILMILAGVFVLTSLLGTCPLYMPFGFSTCKKGK